MEFSQLFCELSALSNDIKLVVDKMLADTRLKCQFSKETNLKEQVLEYFLQLLKESKENQDSIKTLSDEDKKKLITFFGYDRLKKAKNDLEQDREKLLLFSSLKFKTGNGIYYFGNVDEKGELNGKAIIDYSNLFLYHGQVRDGLPHGEGTISSSEEIKDNVFYYKGTFTQGLPNDDKQTATVINGNIYMKELGTMVC